MSEHFRPTVVSLDATLWDEPTTGIGLYTHALIQALGQLGQPLRRLGSEVSGEAPRGNQGRTAWTLQTLPRLLALEDVRLYHALGNFNLPLVKPPGTRFVLTVHDLIPDLLPETVSAAFRWQFRLWLRRSLVVADRLVCVSERTRQDLIQRFGVPEEKMTVVPNGVDHVVTQVALDAAGEASLRGFELPAEFLLFAGAWDVRKNLSLVLDAWEALIVRRPVPLVLVGQSWFGSRPVEARVARLRARGLDLRVLGYQSGPVLYELMRRATVFVFPSLYEGFGLPPLEAMRLGTATVISDRGSLPEVCGDAALQVPADDAQALSIALERLLSSPSERHARRVAGEAWARQFTWERSARQVRGVYEALRVAPRASTTVH